MGHRLEALLVEAHSAVCLLFESCGVQYLGTVLRNVKYNLFVLEICIRVVNRAKGVR